MSFVKTSSLILCLFMSACGPKTIYQDECREKYKNTSCEVLEQTYKDNWKKFNDSYTTRVKGDPHLFENWGSYHIDSRGYTYYSFENDMEKRYKWAMQILKEKMLEKKCHTKTSLNEDISIISHMTHAKSIK